VADDELPQQMLGRVMYVGKLLAAAEAQESIDKKIIHSEDNDVSHKAEGFDPYSKAKSNPYDQKTQF
jgi:hypothetical protein